MSVGLCSENRCTCKNYSNLINTVVVYYESIKRDLKRRIIYEYRCDERLKTKNEESARLADTGLRSWVMWRSIVCLFEIPFVYY